MWHVTARMAWHENGWDGNICKDPASNTYCTGSHSLLSDRLAREKNLPVERDKAGKKARFSVAGISSAVLLVLNMTPVQPGIGTRPGHDGLASDPKRR